MDHNNTITMLGKMLIFFVFLLLIIIAASKTLFRPYRNVLTYWYMTRFDKDYKQAKEIFNELVYKQRVCQRGVICVQDANMKFLELLQDDDRFKNTVEVSAEMSEKVYTVDDFYATTNEFLHDVENFCCDVGSGKNRHKVSIAFGFVREINLLSIVLFYQEEDEHKYSYLLDRKSFPRDTDDGRREMRLTPEPPVTQTV